MDNAENITLLEEFLFLSFTHSLGAWDLKVKSTDAVEIFSSVVHHPFSCCTTSHQTCLHLCSINFKVREFNHSVESQMNRPHHLFCSIFITSDSRHSWQLSFPIVGRRVFGLRDLLTPLTKNPCRTNRRLASKFWRGWLINFFGTSYGKWKAKNQYLWKECKAGIFGNGAAGLIEFRVLYC